MSLPHYRPDIDGLRAIAVLSVLLHHLNAALLPGGFIGVDVFFVISGYLITGQVHKEIQQGMFSIGQFYKRRINRIVPALVTVIVATLCAGFVLLSPSDLLLLARSAVYSIFGLSNLFFWREYGNYFAASSAEAPLLHTWSLGVEEQFYFVWPLLLLLLCKVSGRYVVGVLMALLLGAFVTSEVGTRIAASASYYLLPTRFFELMVGGMLAVAPPRFSPSGPRLSGVAFVVGLGLIGGSLFWTDKGSPFPGMNALWPCLGSALLIWSGQRPCALHRVLTLRPMVFVGLVSYSLYLWHWPLIAFLNYLDIDLDFTVGVAVGATAVLLAWLSWKHVERPMRRQGAALTTSGVFTRRFALPAAFLVAVNAAVAYSMGFPGRFDPQVAELEAAQSGRPNELRAGCHVPTALYSTPPSDRCRLGAQSASPDGILIGDSFANHFTGMLDVMARQTGVSLIDYTMDGCPPIVGYNTGKVATYVERCRLRNESAYAYIEKEKYRRVILAANWPEAPEIEPLLTRSIERILATGAQLTIVLSNESIDKASSCPTRNAMYQRNETCSRAPRGTPPYFGSIHAQFPAIQFIDPNTIICPNRLCNPVVDGTLLYRDSAHLNDNGSRLLGEKLLAAGITVEAQSATATSRPSDLAGDMR